MKKKLFIVMTIAAAALMLGCKKSEDAASPSTTKTTVSGTVSGTWTKGNTYIVSDNIVIAAGQSLTIEEGVKVLMADTVNRCEVIVQGSLYVLGTDANPVTFSVVDSLKPTDKFGHAWGGILAGPNSPEIVLKNAILEYGGGYPTENSASVKLGIYKGTTEDPDPAVYFSNASGKLIIQNSVIRNFGEDGIYVDAGQVLINNNKFYTTGAKNGDAVNLKAPVTGDCSFNLFYAPYTNAFKLGSDVGQSHVSIFNNTIINAGWRRILDGDPKGGSIWVQQGIWADIANNLIVNSGFGVKQDKKTNIDSRSTFFTTQYFGYTQDDVTNFQPNSSTKILAGTDDVISTSVAANDPKFVNYSLATPHNNATFDASWDFHLQSGAPGLTKGNTTDKRTTPNGLTIGGVLYASPAPAAYIGAYGTK